MINDFEHEPRDRGSVWYLGRKAGVAAFVTIALICLPLIIAIIAERW